MSLLERIEATLTAGALAEEGDVETARQLEAEIEADEAGPRERRGERRSDGRGAPQARASRG